MQLKPLKTRRLHADSILMHKIINCAIRANLHNCVSKLSIYYSTTRVDKHKLTKYHAKFDIRKYCFAF